MKNTDKLIGLVGCSTVGVLAYVFGFIDRDKEGNLVIHYKDGSTSPVRIENLTVLVDKK